MKRAVQRSGGMRALLIAEADAGRERWRRGSHTGWPEDTNWELPMLDAEINLRAGRAVGVSSVMVFSALSTAGLPCDDYCSGGRYFGATFLLDENDQLHEAGGA